LRKLGKYEVLGELGHGAMGVVYRARDPIINRLVALKTITTGVADDPALLERFYREAQSAGGLQHPNIVTIYDMGEAGNLPYIAMELVEGENLEQVIAQRSALPLTLKLVYAMQACRAFDYAHKRGIVHRDIKPGNVMVGKDGTVKVVDFGIARVLETSKTQTGMLIGTFAYMSPEQYHGEHADERSDIWSFGVLLYELLSYQRPFTGPTPASLMHCICNEQPSPLRKFVPECPPELEVIVSKILQKSPSERYQSMEDVLLELDPICKTLQSQFVADLVGQGRLLIEQEQFAQARELLRQALQVESGNQQARGLLERANAALKRILNRPKAQQYVEKGQALLEEGKIQQARVEAENALQLDSTFAPAQDLERAILRELDRARLLAEWLEAAKQNLAEGLPDEAEVLLAKVLQAEPSHAQANNLQQQVIKEKAEREKRRRLLESLRQAREFWTHQNYGECVKLLADLDKEFPNEEEVLRLLETVREDQVEQQKQQSLLESRNLLAAGRHEECLALLADLLKRFPHDEEIPGLLEDVRKDQTNQRRLQALAEARSVLATGQYDACISLLTSLGREFPDEQEIPKLLESAHQNQAEQRRQRGVTEARKLLADRRYDECTTLLSRLERQFPGDEEIQSLRRATREEQAEHQKQQRLEEARSLLASRRYQECTALLTTLEKQFPGDGEVAKLRAAVREDETKQRKLQSLGEARNLLASKNYEQSLVLLASLQKEFPEEEEIRKLQESARKEQAEQRKREGLAQGRTLLAARRYDESIAVLSKLQADFPGETGIAKLLESAGKEQAEQRKREGLAQARTLLAARHYDESIACLSKLQADFPGEAEIGRLLATAREDLAEQQKQLKLAEVRSLLAAQSFGKALSLLDAVAASYAKDSAVLKLRTLVEREQEKHARAERVQNELDVLKKWMGEKKYPEVVSRTKELLNEFPADANFMRLAEFALSQQANIERELLFRKTLEETKASFDAGRFEEAIRIAQTGLKKFPANAELLSLYQRSEIQQRKLQVRQQIEHRIREIRVKINREKFSEAIDLAKETLVTLGPDTDLSQLLSSAKVEFEAREKKRIQEQTLQTIRTLIESGDFEGANRTMDEVLESKALESFDPRVQRLSEQIKIANSAAAQEPATSPPSITPSLSKEYAFLQAAPSPSAPPVPEKASPVDSLTAQVTPSQPARSSQPVVPMPPPEIVVSQVAPSVVIPPPASQPTIISPPAVAPPVPESAEVVPEPIVPAIIPGYQPAPVRPPRPISPPSVDRFEPRNFKKPAALGTLSIGLILVIWAAAHYLSPGKAKNPGVSSVSTQLSSPAISPTSSVDPVEALQQSALDASDKRIAGGDLEGALKDLQDAEKLNGPLTAQIKDKEATVRESMRNEDLAKLQQQEAALLQQAKNKIGKAEFDSAKLDLRKIISSGDGGVRAGEARNILDNVIPRRQEEEGLFHQAKQSAQAGDAESLQRAADLLGQVVALDGPRKTEAAELQRNLEAKLNGLKKENTSRKLTLLETAARQNIQQGDLNGARQKIDEIRQNGGDPTTLSRELSQAQATQAQLAQQQREFQQAVEAYNAGSRDKPGLEKSRSDFQSIVRESGPQADRARQYLAEIDKQLDVLNTPPAPPAGVKQEVPNAAAADEAAVRSVVQRFFQAYEQRSPDALRQTWPSMPQKTYDKYKTGWENLSAIAIRIVSESVKISPDGATATVSVQSQEEQTQKGEKKPRKFAPPWTFRLVKTNGTWLITDFQ
jgi:eukaryotic-like serine/threonine-protein kinase